MKTIHFKASKEYDILLDNGLINDIHNLIKPFCKNSNVAIITDDIVDALYGKKLFKKLKENEYSAFKFVFHNGEVSKNIHTLSKILDFLAKNNFKRNDYLIALGGGVVGDITGFASAIYMRGINFIQIPTTLLSMVDASVGGKTAIDLKEGKNLVGSFWQPSLVICDTEIIKKLPSNIFKEGLAEVLKCNIIKNTGIFESVFNDVIYEKIDSIIYNCVELKRDIVEQDEFETNGQRKLLNVGHTFAHAIEKLSNYKISHGYAVGTGIVWESALSYKLDICSRETFETIKKASTKCDLLIDVSFNHSDIINAMKNDKKNNDDMISFVLPINIGNCIEKKLSIKEIFDVFESMGDLI